MDYLLSLLPDRIKNIPIHMDYEGQRKAEKTFQVIIVLFSIVGFVWGYICQQFSQTVYILGAGCALSCLLTLPPWPIYRIKNLQWQKARPDPDATTGGSSKADAQQNKNKKKK